MEFKEFKVSLQHQIKTMLEGNQRLFLTDIERNDLWEGYLNSFPKGSNEIFRERREYECQSCKQFIRPYANLVILEDNQMVSIWDIQGLKHPFDTVARKMSKLVKSFPIKNIFIPKDVNLGVDNNKQLLEDGNVITWDHFYYKLPENLVDASKDSIEAAQGNVRDSKNVFQRSMEELTLDSGMIILELIDQNSLYRGEEFRPAIQHFITYKREYIKLSNKDADNWCWKRSIDNPVSRIRNTSIGTLLIDLSEGMDLDVAVKKFESVMAPTNYKRPKPIFTKRMVEDAQKKVAELGLTESLDRRFAHLKDITVNNILFVNRDAKKAINGTLFDALKEDVIVAPKKFDKVEEVHIDDFIKDILPKSKSIELLMENRHERNLLSLIAPKKKGSKTLFKWDNNFSWAYQGDIADSLKQNVKKAGGNVEGVLRFSIQWNTGEFNRNDFDAHCKEPGGNLIYYGKKSNPQTTGELDIDIISPKRDTPAVENITWTDKSRMQEGVYKFYVHNFRHSGGKEGFSAEIEYNGEIYSYDYAHELKPDERVLVAELEFDRVKGIRFIKSLDSSVSQKELWGIKTNKFSKVNVCMASPNYWDSQVANGNKHYFFFLDGCKNETSPRGFFNEFLNESFTKHRKVFEALGSKTRVEDSDEQLSGLGFSSTQRNSILAKVEGSFSRVIKINF